MELETDLDEDNEKMTDAEVLGAIEWMKKVKATGDDNLPVDIIKAAGEEARRLIVSIMHEKHKGDYKPDLQKGR